jgi:hypothetical protein
MGCGILKKQRLSLVTGQFMHCVLFLTTKTPRHQAPLPCHPERMRRIVCLSSYEDPSHSLRMTTSGIVLAKTTAHESRTNIFNKYKKNFVPSWSKQNSLRKHKPQTYRIPTKKPDWTIK